jgi:hypothetical protein
LKFALLFKYCCNTALKLCGSMPSTYTIWCICFSSGVHLGFQAFHATLSCIVVISFSCFILKLAQGINSCQGKLKPEMHQCNFKFTSSKFNSSLLILCFVTFCNSASLHCLLKYINIKALFCLFFSSVHWSCGCFRKLRTM